MTTTAAETVTAPAAGMTVDFDTRLELARIAIDVACERHGAGAAGAAATEALAHAAKVTEDAPAAPGHPVLKAAGDLIRARGWTQGAMVSEGGALCALGAIQLAASLTGNDYRDVSQVLAERVGASVPLWNDRPGRTKDEVLSMLW